MEKPGSPQFQLSGCSPNVYFNSNAGSLSDIHHPRFIPLPRIEDITFPDRASYRYISETDEIWSRLHKGRLTTSRLNAALGFYQPRAAKILGLPRGYISHNKIVSVYHHLREKAYDVVHDPLVKDAEMHIQAHLASYGKHTEGDESLLENVKIKKSRYLNSQKDIEKVRMAWGSAQEAATVSLLCHQLPGLSFFLMEVGLMTLDPDHLRATWGFHAHDLPPMGATPDGLVFSLTEEDTCTDPTLAAIEFSKKQLDSTRFKVVEIKNVCPFSSRRKGKPGFQIRDRGPRESLDCGYVPQLQFHMACAGVDSAFLVSRSATKGTNVFQMERDDDYIRWMLEIIRCFYRTHESWHTLVHYTAI